MYEIKDEAGDVVGYMGKIVGPVEVTLPSDYQPGQHGLPTLTQFDDALRRELSDFLHPDHPIMFKQTKK